MNEKHTYICNDFFIVYLKCTMGSQDNNSFFFFGAFCPYQCRNRWRLLSMWPFKFLTKLSILSNNIFKVLSKSYLMYGHGNVTTPLATEGQSSHHMLSICVHSVAERPDRIRLAQGGPGGFELVPWPSICSSHLHTQFLLGLRRWQLIGPFSFHFDFASMANVNIWL